MPDSLPAKTLSRKNVKELSLCSSAKSSVDGGSQPLGAVEPKGRADPLVSLQMEFALPPSHIEVLQLYRGGPIRLELVRHKATDNIMVRKVYFTNFASDSRKQLMQELAVMKNCVSDYVVRCVGFTDDIFRNEVGLLMEYMEAGSVGDIVAASGPLPVDILGKVVEAMLSALAFLWGSYRLMHRDVRPSNFLVSAGGSIKLGGFGLSKFMEATRTETYIGSASTRYMAPETVTNLSYSPKADVWSLGISIWEMATGKMLLPQMRSQMELVRAIVLGPPPELPQAHPGPKSLHELLRKCLSKKEAYRPTPKELLATDDFVLQSKKASVKVALWVEEIAYYRNTAIKALRSQAPSTMFNSMAMAAKQANTFTGAKLGALDAVLQQLKDTVSMVYMDRLARKSTPSVACTACRELMAAGESLLHPTGLALRTERDFDSDTARRCPLCRLLHDCVQSPDKWHQQYDKTDVFSRAMSPTAPVTQLKMGTLDKFWHSVLETGSAFEDPHTGSDPAFQLAAAWLYSCLEGHEHCRGSRDLAEAPELPTRVIDVGPPDGSRSPRLHIRGADDDDKTASRGFYLTLSYRWDAQGAAARFKTTEARLDEYMKAIPLGALPQTMQEAVLVARRLGVRYLWIDAFCIVQDSPEDWIAEAGQMARIYKNSLLTIAAAADRRYPTQGCFRIRTRRRQVRPVACPPTPAIAADGRAEGAGAGPDEKDEAEARYVFADRRATGDGARPRSSFDTRGWILQEQLLSPRVLTYADQELFWDCVSLSASETFPDGIPGFYDARLSGLDMRLFKKAIADGGSSTSTTTSREVWRKRTLDAAEKRQQQQQPLYYYYWRKVVEEYSTRRLTREADKLVALLGLAKEVAAVVEDEFVAGLWRKSLWRELLWWTTDPESTTRLRSPRRAPSWSWASLDGAVSYELAGRDRDEDLCRCIEVLGIAAAEADQVEPHVPAATSRRIVVRGRLVPLATADGSQGDESRTPRPHDIPLPHWREDTHGTDPGSAECLIVAASEFYVYGIGVEERSRRGREYRRVGMVYWRAKPELFGWDMAAKDWTNAAELVTLTIC